MLTSRTAIAFLFICIFVSPAYALDELKVDFKILKNTISGVIGHDTVIGEGRVVYNGEHVGFKIWADMEKSGSQPNIYQLTGQRSSKNKVSIRIDKEGWLPDSEGGNGIVINTADNSASFYVLIDSDQTVVADTYPITLKVAVITP